MSRVVGIVEVCAFLIMFVAFGAYVASACAPTTAQDAGATCVVPAGADGCVLPALAHSVAGAVPWATALTIASTECGVTKPAAESIWASHTTAEVIEGFVPRAVGTDAGITPNGGDR